MSTPESEDPPNFASENENESDNPLNQETEQQVEIKNQEEAEFEPEPEAPEPEEPKTLEKESPVSKTPELPDPSPEQEEEKIEEKEEEESVEEEKSENIETELPTLPSPEPSKTPDLEPEIQKSPSPIPSPPTMDEIPSSELESLKFTDSSPNEPDHSPRIMQNNENETVEEKKQISPVPAAQAKTPMRSGIRPPTTVLRTPKIPPPATVPRPSTAISPAPRAISTPRQTASTQPSPRPISKMSRERSDVQKSTSTRSINDVGKFTPKVNAKFVNVKSKVGSVTAHKAGGGNVEIFSEKRLYNAQSKVGSMKNASHVAGGGNVQIESRKLDFSHAAPKVGSKTNYQPAKSDVKIVSEKLTWQAKSKVGSMDNAAHKPAGGNVQILSQKLNWKAESKVGSKDNMGHQPGGGNVKIFDEKIRYVSTDNSRNHSALDISSL